MMARLSMAEMMIDRMIVPLEVGLQRLDRIDHRDRGAPTAYRADDDFAPYSYLAANDSHHWLQINSPNQSSQPAMAAIVSQIANAAMRAEINVEHVISDRTGSGARRLSASLACLRARLLDFIFVFHTDCGSESTR